jgi:hypothetical protein
VISDEVRQLMHIVMKMTLCILYARAQVGGGMNPLERFQKSLKA